MSRALAICSWFVLDSRHLLVNTRGTFNAIIFWGRTRVCPVSLFLSGLDHDHREKVGFILA
jgi:hypothetical protein